MSFLQPLTLYPTLFSDLSAGFFESLEFIYGKCPHPLLLTFLRFDYHVFCEFTICLLKNPSILYWAIFFDLNEDFFDN